MFLVCKVSNIACHSLFKDDSVVAFVWLGMVSGIWLQTGSDLKKLEKGIKHLRKATEAEPVPIYGSFFLPSKK